MEINILLFETLKDRAGRARLILTVPDGASVGDVRDALAERFPEMDVNIEQAVAALNRETTCDTEIVHDGDEVALFPPVTGG
jgi:molybdopterin converting factor subunit 1